MPPRPRELGEGALKFARWYTSSRFALMEDFADDLATRHAPRDVPILRDRFLRAVRHGKGVLWARFAVTVLLAFSLVATVAGWIVSAVSVPPLLEGDVAATEAAVARIAAASASLTVVLVLLRLAFDRYLDLVATSATFLAIEIASARAAGREEAGELPEGAAEGRRRGTGPGAAT